MESRTTRSMRAATFVLAVVFALPACFTSMAWRATTSSALAGEAPAQDATAGEDRGELRVLLTPEAVASLGDLPGWPPESRGAMRLVPVSPDGRRALEAARDRGWFAIVDLRAGAEIATVSMGPALAPSRPSAPPDVGPPDVVAAREPVLCEVDFVGAAPAGRDPRFAAVILRVHEERTDGVKVVRAVLLTPFTLVLDVVLAPLWIPFLLFQ
jgi:hypothetical protein